MRGIIFTIVLTFLLGISVLAQPENAEWIFIQPQDSLPNGQVIYRTTFNIDFKVESAYLKYTCKTPEDISAVRFTAYINGIRCGESTYWRDVQYVSVGGIIAKGDNELIIEVRWKNCGAPGPIRAKLVMRGIGSDETEKEVTIRTSSDWEYSMGDYYPFSKEIQERRYSKVAVVNSEISDPVVIPPKVDTGFMAGITNLKLRAGTLSTSLDSFCVRDYSDKFRFLEALGCSMIETFVSAKKNYIQPGEWFWGIEKIIAHNIESEGYDLVVLYDPLEPPEWILNEKDERFPEIIQIGERRIFSVESPSTLELCKSALLNLKSALKHSLTQIIIKVYPIPSANQFFADLVDIAYRISPESLVSIKLDSACLDLENGIDITALIKLLSSKKASVCIANDVNSILMKKRVATACKYYNVPLETELPSSNSRYELARNLFIDTTCGVTAISAQPETLIQASDLISRVRPMIDGQYSISRVALFYAQKKNESNGSLNLSIYKEAAEELRDVVDYDVVDDHLIADDVLVDYDVLVILDGNIISQIALDKINKWIENGGKAIIRGSLLPIKNERGEESVLFQSTASLQEIICGEGKIALWNESWSRR